MKTAFIYSEKFGAYYYGAEHPMRPVRLRLTYELMEALNLIGLPEARIVEARQAHPRELQMFHTPEYLRVLKEANTGIIPVNGTAYGIGFGDNPVFNGMYEWSAYCAGASIQAADLVARSEVDTSFNVSGGLHHAMPGRASGFCYINDAVLAIKHLVAQGKRVAYVDIDAHHGDGVEYAFYDTDAVLTISLHESGQWIFPGTGFVTDIGIKEGTGFSVNLPFPPGAGDEVFVNGFDEIVPPFIEAFKPDVLVTQLGVDSFETDPIAHLSLTTNGFETMVKRFRSFGLPWVALGGGGYDMSNVSRAWAIAWAVMNRVKPPNTIPKEFILKNGDIYRSSFLKDTPFKAIPLRDEDVACLANDIKYLKEEVLPFVKKGKGVKKNGRQEKG